MGRKSTNQTPSRNNQVDTIDLVELGRALLFHWKLILAAMVLCGGIAYIYCRFFVTPVFSSTAGLYVFSKSTSVTSLADLQIGSSLTKDYETVITSRPILDRVITRLNLEADYKTLRGKIDILLLDPPSDELLAKCINITSEELEEDANIFLTVRHTAEYSDDIELHWYEYKPLGEMGEKI